MLPLNLFYNKILLSCYSIEDSNPNFSKDKPAPINVLTIWNGNSISKEKIDF